MSTNFHATTVNTFPEKSPEKWRPAIHFSPQKNWINDPNGLVYFEGEYHLFYQYNPHGMDWGHMSWGHAVSSDLLHWEELEVAIPEREFMVFSGCAVVDWDNTSGLGDGKKPPLLAFYTAFHSDTNRQTQRLAYSHDKGRSWEEYDGNPIIDLDMEHFRDPSVFWCAESNCWVMAVALSREHKVQIYNSEDLKNWELVSEAGPFGNTGGQWECPALFSVTIEDTIERVWILKIDVDKNIINEGSGSQYFTGQFDGKIFVPDANDGHTGEKITDFGGDFYAAITWSDLPEQHRAPVWIGWFSNHQTGKFFPTSPWRGSMTIPRELFGFRENGALALGQRPISNLISLRSDALHLPNMTLSHGERFEIPAQNVCESLEISFHMEAKARSVAGIVLRDNQNRDVIIGYDSTAKEVFVDRRNSNSDFNSNFASKHTAPIPETGPKCFQIIYDRSSVEVFVDGGRRVISEKIFPDGLKEMELFSDGGDCELMNIHVFQLSL